MIVDCAIYRKGRRQEPASASGDRPHPLPAADCAAVLREARGSDGAFVWMGLHEPTQEEFDLVAGEFGLHPLAVEDALRAHQRPKLEAYDGSLFLVLKPVSYDDDADVLSAGELMLFVGDSFVVSVRHGAANPLAEVRERLEQDRSVLRHGPAAVMYAVCDAVVDTYLEVASQLHADLDELEAEVFESTRDGARRAAGAGNRTASRIYGFKRQLLGFRRATGPLLEPMDRLARSAVPFVDAAERPFFRDVHDHLERVNEQVDGLDRLLADIHNAHLTHLGVQQNDDMRRISAWGSMFAVPTGIAGLYGMNFDHMPELHQVWGYPAMLLVTAGLCTALWRFFKRHGWL